MAPNQHPSQAEIERLVQELRQEAQDGSDPEIAKLKRDAFNAEYEASWRKRDAANKTRKRLLEDPDDFILRSLLGIQEDYDVNLILNNV
jgi:hypothetical protein